jgi:hypothetical protein
MTRDDIIRMAEEGGIVVTGDAVWRLCELVAAAEREAIAQMIEDAPPLVDFCKNEQNGCLVCGFTPKLAAKSIRARGQA